MRALFEWSVWHIMSIWWCIDLGQLTQSQSEPQAQGSSKGRQPWRERCLDKIRLGLSHSGAGDQVNHTGGLCSESESSIKSHFHVLILPFPSPGLFGSDSCSWAWLRAIRESDSIEHVDNCWWGIVCLVILFLVPRSLQPHQPSGHPWPSQCSGNCLPHKIIVTWLQTTNYCLLIEM